MNGGESAEGVARAANAWKRRSETAATKSHPARSEVRGHGRGCPYHVAGLWEQAQAWMPERRGHAVTAGRAPIRHRRIGRGRRERPEARQKHPRLTGPRGGQRLASESCYTRKGSNLQPSERFPANPRRRASVCLAGLRRLSIGRHLGGPSPGGRGEGIRAAPWLRGGFPQTLGVVPRFAWPASAGSR
jgi:hypothetical protein